MSKLLLIGGYPKGFTEPFHPATRSGKVLRDILQRNNIKFELLDLWNTESEEKEGIIKPNKIIEILRYKDKGFIIIALGKYVHNRMLKQCKSIPIRYLPHPAARRIEDIHKLETGLKQLIIIP